jgi:hypothetical protein
MVWNVKSCGKSVARRVRSVLKEDVLRKGVRGGEVPGGGLKRLGVGSNEGCRGGRSSLWIELVSPSGSTYFFVSWLTTSLP